MTGSRSVKSSGRSPLSLRVGQHPKTPQWNDPATTGLIVGVIASTDDLRVASRMRKPPDLFELRLDCFARSHAQLQKKLSQLRAPLVITARHPAEGGANELSLKQRVELLLHFVPYARYIDVELRSAKSLGSVLQLAKRLKLRRIISFHDFSSTPSSRSLRAKAREAESCGADIFKIATRTDTPGQLARLFDFVGSKHAAVAVSAMGIGKLGAVSRIVLSRRGSILNYASLRPGQIEGQLSIEQLRSVIGH
jgi:3-dehydroquinate dehydratase I